MKAAESGNKHTARKSSDHHDDTFFNPERKGYRQLSMEIEKERAGRNTPLHEKEREAWDNPKEWCLVLVPGRP